MALGDPDVVEPEPGRFEISPTGQGYLDVRCTTGVFSIMSRLDEAETEQLVSILIAGALEEWPPEIE